MKSVGLVGTAAGTVPFDEFWEWVQTHYNCILRMGSIDAVLYDDDASHWRMSEVETDQWLVQLCRGKHVAGEIVVSTPLISYVQFFELEAGEYCYELIREGAGDRECLFHFVLTHTYDGVPESETGWMN